MSAPFEVNYAPPGAVAAAFMQCDKFLRGIRGPFGSGKSVTCCMEIFRRAQEQAPGPDGLRKTRWAVIRNTSPELKTTTIKTWLDWFPEKHFGKMNWTPPFTHRIAIGDIRLEVIFLALDSPEDAKKLLSLELTGAFVNEAREVPKEIIDAATGRVGRFPSMKDGGPTWYGVILDTNPMPEDHWWAYMSGAAPIPESFTPEEARMLSKPDNWEFFDQPAAMIEVLDAKGAVIGYENNPLRENAANLTEDYYKNMVSGKTKDFINVNILNRIGALKAGKVVYPDYNAEIHEFSVLEASPDAPLRIGVDFGLTPAAVFGQKIHGRWYILGELCARDMGATRFAQVIKDYIADKFPQHAEGSAPIYITGDPAGDHRADTDERTPYMIFRNNGLMVQPASSNDPIIRIEAVTRALTTMSDGRPNFAIAKTHCGTLCSGFIRGYSYRKLKVSGAARYADQPDKNMYSHPHDALQYLILGAGDGMLVTTGAIKGGSKFAGRAPSPLASRRTVSRRRSSVFERNRR